jgi:hypothetical protein
MGSLSRRKGARHELDLVRLAREAGFPGAERRAPMQCANGDERHPDVAGIPLLFVEAKHEKRCSPKAYAREYLGERPGYVPVVCWRENGMGPRETVAELRFVDLLTMVRELTDLRETNARLRHAACAAPAAHGLVDEVGAYPTEGKAA